MGRCCCGYGKNACTSTIVSNNGWKALLGEGLSNVRGSHLVGIMLYIDLFGSNINLQRRNYLDGPYNFAYTWYFGSTTNTLDIESTANQNSRSRRIWPMSSPIVVFAVVVVVSWNGRGTLESLTEMLLGARCSVIVHHICCGIVRLL